MPLWVKRGSLRFPEEKDTPVIMVGPGTGVAPFRSAVQERVSQERRGKSSLPGSARLGSPSLAKPCLVQFSLAWRFTLAQLCSRCPSRLGLAWLDSAINLDFLTLAAGSLQLLLSPSLARFSLAPNLDQLSTTVSFLSRFGLAWFGSP